MKRIREISHFFYGQYFAEGLMITLGCIIPLLVCIYAGYLNEGTLISFGALLIGLSDTPGAPSHRRLGMLSTIVLGILTYLIIVLVNFSIPLTTIFIAVLSFLFAMFAVFNARAATVGAMCTLLMLFNVQHAITAGNIWSPLLLTIIGGLWYMLLSMSVIKIRPYRIAQQELAESIRYVADYIRLKANFYDPNVNIENNYIKLIEKQVEVNKHQESVRDILFQSKRSIKDTTKIGRYLTLIFSDIVDLFEQSLTTQYDYNAIKTAYGQYGVLIPFKHTILKVTNELDNIAYAINANKLPKPTYTFENDMNRLLESVESLDKKGINTIPLKKVIINIRSIIKYLDNIYSYNSTNVGPNIPKEEIDSASQFITRDQIDWKKFRSNLSLESSAFRHALRMAIVLSGTYLILNLVNFSPNGIYWTLLTIMVILKPGFGLTQERNLQRLVGTLVGGIIGAAVIFFIADVNIRFALLICFFLAGYSLFRINYIVAVMFITPYVLIMLSFHGTNTLEMVAERVIDTFLGGAIAFVSSYIIFPNWESTQFRDNVRSLLIANYNYLAQAIQILSGKELTVTNYKLARKEVYIASANMGSTFQRMLTEPKWRQKYTKEVNRFVILDHILSSHSANLLTQVNQADISSYHAEHVKLLKKALSELNKAITLIPPHDDEEVFEPKEEFPNLNEVRDENDESKLITEQLQFLSKISGDLHKVTQELVNRAAELESEKQQV
ncbi:FUSC family protein [Sphingobacterium chuzhouense]|uniref:FUSC family protein n=1 Tax=Sphingobacterium chuzhouense TaxID=1742264 RepID=A0ABR7XVF2_9SPHI|nr:FUSC family membrane protein [Sphingobacterium chuzhouense]MBD1423030.1 FUSC family protein [Sphingobacterium chuzhouense]